MAAPPTSSSLDPAALLAVVAVILFVLFVPGRIIIGAVGDNPGLFALAPAPEGGPLAPAAAPAAAGAPGPR